MDSLPNELLIHIASLLDSQPPSVDKFAHEPSALLTCSEQAHLKSLSRVSRRWRKITLPILFRYSRIALDTNPQWVPIDARLIESMQSQLTCLSEHELHIYQRMRSKFKSSSMFAFDEAFDDLLINLCRIQDGDNFLKSVPYILWFPHLPSTFAHFAAFISYHGLKHHVKSVVVYTEKEYELRHVATADAPLSRAVAEIWSQIFLCFEPARIVVAAPPCTLAGLLDTQMLTSDTWAFDMKMHYVELQQPEPTRDECLTSPCLSSDPTLIHKRPWYHLGYNEGSSVAAYSTYEYHLKQSPRILYTLLLRLAKEAQDGYRLRSFSFFAVFPFSTNIMATIRALQKLPSLHRIQFKLAPGGENDLLSVPKRMGRAQAADLWLEWNESYKVIASFLGTYDFAHGSEFVGSDFEQPMLAREIDDYMQLLHDRGNGWRKTFDGIWVRDHALDK